MRVSQYFLPVLKENPKEAQIASHRYMLRSGMIRQLVSGIYEWLPLGLKVLRKVEHIVREEMNKAGSLELLMPTMQPTELWQESGRGNYGKETLTATDRHGRELMYGPTNEEVITDVFRKTMTSYKQLPKNLYHIQWKFRDEIRPRFGVMRGREFLMKDAYSFDVMEKDAVASYNHMYRTYFRIFKRMGLQVIPFQADTGLIGGKLSHEFQVIAQTGESEVFYDKAFEAIVEQEVIDIDAAQECYSAADDKHDPEICTVPADQLVQARGIEVGHIFYFGNKYSAPMGANITTESGAQQPVLMGAYGIGVSRLLGAIIEVHHDDKGIIWPKEVAPFAVGLINIRAKDADCVAACDALYAQLQEAKIDVLYDDRDESAGAKFATMELIGLPTTLTIGPRGLKEGKAELGIRATGEKQDVALGDVLGALQI